MVTASPATLPFLFFLFFLFFSLFFCAFALRQPYLFSVPCPLSLCLSSKEGKAGWEAKKKRAKKKQVGKGNDLYKRISDYYRQYYLNHNKGSSVICRAILKYSLDSFTLNILEVNPLDLALKNE